MDERAATRRPIRPQRKVEGVSGRLLFGGQCPSVRVDPPLSFLREIQAVMATDGVGEGGQGSIAAHTLTRSPRRDERKKRCGLSFSFEEGASLGRPHHVQIRYIRETLSFTPCSPRPRAASRRVPTFRPSKFRSPLFFSPTWMEDRSDYFKGARLSDLMVFPMSEIIDRVVLGSCRFTGTNLERGPPGHLVLGGVLHHAHVKSRGA